MPDIVKSNEDDGRNDYILQWLDAFDGEDEDEQGFVGRLYGLCLRELQDFRRQQRDISKSRSIVLKECLGRLYLWGEPFGGGDLGKALGQFDELGDVVLEHLVHIGEILLRKSTPSTPSPKAPHQPSKQITELKSIVEQGKLLVSGKQDEVQQTGNEYDEEYDSGSDGSSDSGSYDTIEDISFATTCLMELGSCLKDNLRHTEAARNQSSNLASVPFAVSDPAMIYVSLIRDKFKQAHHKLVERLGEANWQRHRDIRDKMEKTELSPEERTKLSGERSIACSLFRPYSDFHDSGIGTSVPAQTEYAPSHTSFLSSNTEGEHASLRVPKEPPEAGAGKLFQCFLCRCVISNVRNRIDWKMHVFADLRPYVCTFPDCKDELAQFTTRAAWADHEFTEHRYDMVWNCPECPEKFAGASDWEQHLDEVHQRIFTGPQLHWARNTANQMHPRPAETEECPLCRVVLGKPRRTFVKHVARHMEEIALMTLPRSIEEDSDESSDSTDQISSVSENAELLATEIIDRSSSSGTLRGSLDAEDSELQPVESGAETNEETKLQSIKSAAEIDEEMILSSPETRRDKRLQTGKGAAEIDEKKNLQSGENAAEIDEKMILSSPEARRDSRLQTGEITAEIDEKKILQSTKSAAETSGERKLQSVESVTEASGERKLQSVKSATEPGGESSLQPPKKFRTRWICGHCGEGDMSIRFNTYCVRSSCGKRKDAYAREYYN